ncbi:MAG: outer membrane protein [Devosia sp.]
MSFRNAVLLSAASFALLSGAAQAADLLVAAEPAPAVASSSWDGFYVGIFGGYAQGTLTTTDNFLPVSPYEEDYAGYLVGLQGGYNFTLSDNVVGGFGVDIAYNGAATEDPSYVVRIGWSGSATARLGLDLGGIVPYALGGIALANVEVADFPAATESHTHVGYTVGAGIEVALTDAVSANLEYRYTGFGTQIYDLTNITTGDFADHSVRAGVNYHFN